MNGILQDGNEGLKIAPLTDSDISRDFDTLKPHLEWLHTSLNDFKNFDTVNLDDVHYRVDHFLIIMDGIVNKLQKKSEKDIKSMMVIELELAIFSILIIIFEFFFIVTPIINRILDQKKKLSEIAWHQSHVFNSHMKNISDLQYVLKAEKNPERQREIYGFISEELDQLKKVSHNMVNSLKNTADQEKSNHFFIQKIESLLEKYNPVLKEKKLIGDETVHSVKL